MIAEIRDHALDGLPDGKLRLYGIIGAPVEQVRAPLPMTRLLREAGANAAVIPMHVQPAHLVQVFAASRCICNLDGFIVTVPHKVAMAALVDRLTERARLVGAVNLVRREPDGAWLGDISDGAGFTGGLLQSGFQPAGQHAFLVGAGGVGSAIAVELARSGASVRVYDVIAVRAAALAARLAAAGLDVQAVSSPDPAGAALVVNATPLGMKPDDPLPLDPTLLSSNMLVAEVVMNPEVTRFLEQARARGCLTQLGEAVMVNQLTHNVTFFLNNHHPEAGQ